MNKDFMCKEEGKLDCMRKRIIRLEEDVGTARLCSAMSLVMSIIAYFIATK